MEAVGLASGVAGLITLAITVSDAIYAYSSAIKNQSATIRELGNEISTLAAALTEFRQFLCDDNNRHLIFEDDSVLVSAYQDCNRRIERIGQVFLETQNGSKARRAWNKVLWPFQQKEAVLMVENLRRFTQVFNFAVNMRNCLILTQTSSNVTEQLQEMHDQTNQVIDQVRKLPETLRGEMLKHSTQVEAQVKSIIDLIPLLNQQSNDMQKVKDSMQISQEREQHRLKGELLDWLVPGGGVSKHHELQKKRAKETCQWFLEDEEFVDWANAKSQSRDFLCVGGPGTGKTILCSIIIDHLQRIHADGRSIVIHYYCDFSEKNIQNSSHFARSLLRQLAQLSDGIPASVMQFYRNTKYAMQDLVWLEQLHEVLRKLVASFDRCYLVLDAIDETDDREQRGIFKVLNVMRSSKGHLRTIATVRPHKLDIERQFPEVKPFEIGASATDVYNYLRMKMDDNPLSSDILDDSLRIEILTKLCDVAQGMFLLPALQIDHILEQVTTGGARKALRNLSTTLPEVFKTTIQRIHEFPKAKKDLALRTLLWISHAARPLTIAELQHALAVQLDEDDFDYEEIPAVNTIIESCCGLVELVGDPMDVRPRIVTFVHFSLHEFLLDDGNGLVSAGDLIITQTCLKYLSFKSLHFLAQSNRKTLLQTLSHFPFLEYASVFWGYHARDLAIESYQTAALHLFGERDALFLALRVRDAHNPNDSEWEQTTQHLIDSGSGGISIAASFGLANLLKLLLTNESTCDLNIQNVYGSTPLHECAMYGWTDAARILIANGADVQSRKKGGASPFYLAVAYDRLNLCQILLESGHDQVNIARNDGYTPLHRASDYGTQEMVQMLLQAGAELNVQADTEKHRSMTPLHLASRRNNLPVVHLLVHAGADLEIRNTDGCSALDIATIGGHFDLVQYLIQNGAKLDGKSRGGWTTLHRAARSGQVEIARLLLESGANLLERDFRRCLPLTLAAKRGDTDCINLFLNHRPMFALHQLQNLDIERESAKIKAYSTSHYAMYKYLRDREIKLLAAHEGGSSPPSDATWPLVLAIEKGSLSEVVDLLTTHPGLLEKRDSLWQLPLHTAFLEQQLDIAVELLDRGVPIDSRGYHEWTPLLIAAAAGSYRMVSLALQYNANIHAESKSNNNALHKASSSSSMPVVLELLRCGADPFSRNDHLMTPLHIAASHNFMEAARELLKPKWHQSKIAQTSPEQLIFTRDKRNHLPRWWAENAGHLELADFLRLEEMKAKRASTSKVAKLPHRRLTPQSRRLSPLRHSPDLSRSNTETDSVSSYTTMSRTTTRDSISTRPTSASLLSPVLTGHFSRRNTSSSSFSACNDGEDHGEDWSEGVPSPARTPTLASASVASLNSSGLFIASEEPSQRRERSYAEMLLEWESD